MLDTRIHGWLARLPGNAPRGVSLALAALIAVELARIAISLVSGGPVKSPRPVLMNVAPRAAQHAGFDTQSVVSAHLFGVAAPDPSAEDPANAPQSSANLVLAGTIATQDPKRGVAIISDGGPSKVYSVGDNIGGAALHSVYLDHVILDRSGALERPGLRDEVAKGGKADVVARSVGISLPHQYDLVGIGIGERTEEHRFDDAEDRGRGPDGQSEREHRDERERWRTTQ